MQTPRELQAIQKILPRLFRTVKNDFYSQKIQKEQKKDQTVLTETDVKAEQLITKTIKNHFPGDLILAEETSPRTKKGARQRLWVIDPLCGSGNFSAGILFFTTNIALFENKKPVFSLVIDYPLKTYYWTSEKNKGVFEGNQKIVPKIELGQEVHINVDYGYLIANRSSKLSHYSRIVSDLVQKGYEPVSPISSLAFAYAAIGKLGAFVSAEDKPWDMAAASYLMEKNGGPVTDFEGKPWTLETKNFVGSLNKKIHSQILSIIRKNWL